MAITPTLGDAFTCRSCGSLAVIPGVMPCQACGSTETASAANREDDQLARGIPALRQAAAQGDQAAVIALDTLRNAAE